MYYLELISSFLIVLPLILFFAFSKFNAEKRSRVIFLYLIVVCFIEVLGHFFFDSEIGKFSLNSLFTILEFVILSYFFFLSFSSKKIKRLILLVTILFIPLSLVYFYTLLKDFKSGVISFDSLSVTLSALIIIIYSILFLFDLIQKPHIEFIYATFEFWIVVGIMIYFSGTFFLFLQIQRLSDEELESFWVINLICNILKTLFFAIAFTQPKAKYSNDYGVIAEID